MGGNILKLPRWAWIALVALAVLVAVYWYARAVQRAVDLERAAKEKAAQALELNRRWLVRYQASETIGTLLAAERDRLAQQVTVAARRADSLGQVADSARLALQVALTPHDSLRACLGGWSACELRVQAVQAVAVADSARAVLADSARAVWEGAARAAVGVQDSLVRALKAVEQVGECRFLFWRCPSRGVMFAGGAIVGAVALIAVRR